MRLLLTLILILSTGVARAADGDDLGELQRDLAEKFVNLLHPRPPLEQSSRKRAMLERMYEYARRAESLEIETLISRVDPRTDSVDRRARELGKKLLGHLRASRARPPEERGGEAIAMIDTLAQVYSLIGANSGTRFGSYEQGFGRAAVVLTAGLGAGILLFQNPGVFAHAREVGEVLIGVQGLILASLPFNRRDSYARILLTKLGGTEHPDDVRIVKAFDRFWSFLEDEIIKDPTLADFARYEGQVNFVPKLRAAILEAGGSTAAVCDAWLIATEPPKPPVADVAPTAL